MYKNDNNANIVTKGFTIWNQKSSNKIDLLRKSVEPMDLLFQSKTFFSGVMWCPYIILTIMYVQKSSGAWAENI